MNVDERSRIVVDASVFAKPYSPRPERHVANALALFDRWEGGSLEFVAPELIVLEVLNVGACTWRMGEPALGVLLASAHEQLTLVPVAHERVAHWASRGLTAYDAAYVAVAEAEQLPLVTDDDRMVEVAPGLAVALASIRG